MKRLSKSVVYNITEDDDDNNNNNNKKRASSCTFSELVSDIDTKYTDNLYVEKHVRITEELPLVYNPRSFSLPDLHRIGNPEKAVHKHPLLQFSITSSSTDIDVTKYIRKESNQGCSPVFKRKNSVKNSHSAPATTRLHFKWKKNLLTRHRGKSYPPSNKTQTRYIQENHSEIQPRPGFLHILKKLKLFGRTKGVESGVVDNSFYESPRLRTPRLRSSVSESNILLPGSEDQSYTITDNECYRPINDTKSDMSFLKPVELIRIRSLPIL